MTDSVIPSRPKGISAITLFVEDLAAAKAFYLEVFGLPVAFDDDSAVFRFGTTLINLLKTAAARELIDPAPIAPRDAGSRMQLTIDVDDVDATCAELTSRGVELLNGPMDRPGECEPPASAIPAAISGRSPGSRYSCDDCARNDHAEHGSTPMAMDYEAFTRMIMDDIRSNGRPTMGPMAGRPLMILTTKGAKSGQDRSAVVTYSRDGDRYVVAGSKSGEPTHPAWYHNLKAHPEVTVEAGREKFRARATDTSGAERERLWNQHVAEHPVFGGYPALTERVIPVIVLERID